MVFQKRNRHPYCSECIDGGATWDTICNVHLVEKVNEAQAKKHGRA